MNEIRQRGKVRRRSIVFAEPLPFAEDTEVIVTIEAARVERETPLGHTSAYEWLPIFGMWADRADMKDSVGGFRRSVASGSSDRPAGVDRYGIMIDVTQEIAEAAEFLGAQRNAGSVKIRVVSVMELITGCRNAKELHRMRAFLAAVTVEPITSQASRSACKLIETYHLRHGLEIPDALFFVMGFRVVMTEAGRAPVAPAIEVRKPAPPVPAVRNGRAGPGAGHPAEATLARGTMPRAAA